MGLGLAELTALTGLTGAFIFMGLLLTSMGLLLTSPGLSERSSTIILFAVENLSLSP